MVNVELLKKKIADSKIPITSICKEAGILRESLYNKFDNPATFKVDDIQGLTVALKLTKAERDSIFFAKECELNSR